ncbi:DUF2357 domain-containing protein [Dictyobacter arantiisoli]|uniref:DUF2357 domain-containing protein n=1 Tax=Dictyobacter arantiisoli TaxID=2014874 RepID=A0A5A5TIX0_9CHLR|nr:DUF2357 domain-containing protein [Dictyobacter arantiisoli]GCF11076.1 hypothetical protein KDI_46400 [Dictyobacter arantiisoli]
MAIPVSGVNTGLDTWLTINDRPVSFQAGTENLAVEAMEYKQNYVRATVYAPHPVEIFIDQKPLNTYNYGLWLWKPFTYAGLYELRVHVPGSDYPDQVTKVRVVPQYFTQKLYQNMQEDLSNIAADLLFNLVSSVSERVKTVQRLQDASPLQDYRHIRLIIDHMGEVLGALRRDPYRVLSNQTEQREWSDVWQFNGDSQAIGGDTLHIARKVGRHTQTLTLPARWQVPQTVLSYDVYENRLLKQFLKKQLITKLNAIQERAVSEIGKRKIALTHAKRHNFSDVGEQEKGIVALEHVIDECQNMKQRCLQWSNNLFLRSVRGEVSSNKATQVFLKHPHYSRFYKLYLQFQQRLQISLNSQTYITELSLRKMSELYEMWSVFALTRITIDLLKEEGYEASSQHLFYEIDKGNFHFEVRKNIASIVLARDDKRIKIIYEPNYPNYNIHRAEGLVTTNGRSLPQTPDMSIEVYQQNKPAAVCIFDAKYKRVREDDGYFYPLVEDIDKMSNYAANIQYQRYDTISKRFRPSNIVTSAYVLYPGNRVYEEADGKIGGIPLRPNMSLDHQQEVRQKLRDILYEAQVI